MIIARISLTEGASSATIYSAVGLRGLDHCSSPVMVPADSTITITVDALLSLKDMRNIARTSPVILTIDLV
jgi:hypothetical protein